MGRLTKKFTTSMTVAILAPMLFVALSVTAPGIASARCDGDGDYVRSTLIVSGEELVAERPDNGACNSNDTYYGHFAAKQSGWRAWVFIRANDQWVGYSGSGYNGNNNKYSYTDGDSSSRMALCADNGSTTICGWGSTWRSNSYPSFTIPASGLNHGF